MASEKDQVFKKQLGQFLKFVRQASNNNQAFKLEQNQ
jgi:hypothetical protein